MGDEALERVGAAPRRQRPLGQQTASFVTYVSGRPLSALIFDIRAGER
jgi:hypothetical protein